MKKLNELIVVEGKHDSANLRRYFAVEIWETGGTGLTEKFLQDLKAQEKPIIVFTDADSSGRYIRETITREIPNCRHAYLKADESRKKAKVGVEFAGQTALENALANLISYNEDGGDLVMSDLMELKLAGLPEAQVNRQKVSANWHLGDCNGKTLLKRLNARNITKKDLKAYLDNEH